MERVAVSRGCRQVKCMHHITNNHTVHDNGTVLFCLSQLIVVQRLVALICSVLKMGIRSVCMAGFLMNGAKAEVIFNRIQLYYFSYGNEFK